MTLAPRESGQAVKSSVTLENYRQEFHQYLSLRRNLRAIQTFGLLYRTEDNPELQRCHQYSLLGVALKMCVVCGTGQCSNIFSKDHFFILVLILIMIMLWLSSIITHYLFTFRLHLCLKFPEDFWNPLSGSPLVTGGEFDIVDRVATHLVLISKMLCLTEICTTNGVCNASAYIWYVLLGGNTTNNEINS